MKFNLDFIVESTNAELLSSPHTSFKSYSIDNRENNIKDCLFIPLVGEVHDAHKFVSSAIENGATGVLVHKWESEWESLKEKATFIKVEDTLKALQSFSKAWRKELNGKVLALTGSNGKTTTKDFLGQILSQFGSTHVSYGSFNNHWGVPFTLLDCDKSTEFCVTEMGMNHAGEISLLMSIADPDYVTVTNVGKAHMGNFSNGIEGVAAAKEEIYESAKAQARLLFNIDNKWTLEMYKKYMDRASFTYSTKNFSADVYFKKKNQTETGMLIEGQIGGVLGKKEVHFWGDQNIENLAAAVTLAYIGGCKPEKIWDVLDHCHTGWGRNQWLKLESGGKVLFDGYNANPDSFQQLLDNITTLVQSEQKCVAIFGEMLELGDKTSEEHYQLGLKAGSLPWEECLFIGPSAADFERGFKDSKNHKKPVILNTYKESLDLDLLSMVDNESQFIVKGSRGGALERVVERLKPIGFLPK